MSAVEERCYITFSILTQVLKAEKCLESQGLRYWVVPIPREISSDCGMCIMCYPEKFEAVIEVLNDNGINYNNTYFLNKKKFSLF